MEADILFDEVKRREGTRGRISGPHSKSGKGNNNFKPKVENRLFFRKRVNTTDKQSRRNMNLAMRIISVRGQKKSKVGQNNKTSARSLEVDR